MKYAELPKDEAFRLKEIEYLKILNSGAEDSYDNITKLASFICGTPISLITILGEKKQWFKSKVGTEICETDRDVSFCSHAILDPEELLEIPDTREDERFKDNPNTLGNPPVLFYAGMPIKTGNGAVLGTLCVLDNKPKKLNQTQKNALKSLAKQVENLFQTRRYHEDLEQARKELRLKNNQLKNFASTVSHDMKMPLANIILTTDILKARYSDKIDEDGKNYLDYLKQSSFKLSNYISGILEHYESDSLQDPVLEDFDIQEMLEDIIDLLNINHDCEINLPENKMTLHCNRMALEQIFLNLLGNAIKYNDKQKAVIDIECYNDSGFYHFTVKDNGIGIPRDKQEEIFELFTVIADSDRNGNRGNGIGLSTVKKLIVSLGGEISVESEVKKGTLFNFRIKADC